MKYKEVALRLVILVISTGFFLFTPMTILATESIRKLSETNSFEEYEKQENLNIIADEEKLIIEDGVLISYEGNAEKIIIPDNVTSIGMGAFSWCTNLKEVVIPNSVTSIEEEAFLWCSNLEKINIPSSVTFIGDRAFVDCVNLTEISIPNGIKAIGEATFYGCSNLEEITIPDSVISIGKVAFVYCTSLKEVTIPNGVTSIGEYTFYGCSSLKEINIPDSVTCIGNASFYGCSSLREVTIPNSVMSIEELAFVDCINLTEIIIPDGVTFIGNETFLGCSSFAKIIIPNSVISIGQNVFDNVSKKFILYGYENSYAQQYAEENDIPFEILKEENELPVIPPTTNPFTDVSDSMYYYQPVLWALENNVTAGINATEFAPEQSCTRGQVVTFLWRAMGCPEPTTTKNPFVDVDSNQYYYKAVLWALENGITAGINATEFAPDQTVTRGQFVTFLHRAENKPSYSVSNPFTDVPNTYYYDAVLWAYENGVTAGTDSTHFSPEDSCTRGQVVTFLYRALNDK